uniref:Hexosyltransferase n=1 Tax=Clytia hemisphaerica TaxID=252671 RepID=A0A7M5V2A5_9CNID
EKIKFDNSAHYKVIILVTSFAKHFERRQWIRKAWGNQTFWNESVENWQVIFNVGAVDSAEVQQKLVEESKNHGDMLILDVPENFHKLSEKVMAALYWVYTKFSFEFVFKTDDDVFIHMQRLLTKLNTTM